MQMKLKTGLQGPGDKEKLAALLAQSSVRTGQQSKEAGWKGAIAQKTKEVPSESQATD